MQVHRAIVSGVGGAVVVTLVDRGRPPHARGGLDDRPRQAPRPPRGCALTRAGRGLVERRRSSVDERVVEVFRTAAAKRLEQKTCTHPAVILMDLSLPGIDGWEATRRLKEATATRRIHIVAVTGHAEAECRARAIDVGFDLFVAKPSLPLDIAQRIAHLLGGKLERSPASRRP